MTKLDNKDDLKNGFEALLRAEEAKDKAADHLSEIYASMKSKGYDIVALKKVVADYKKGMEKVLELESMIDIYRDNLELGA